MSKLRYLVLFFSMLFGSLTNLSAIANAEYILKHTHIHYDGEKIVRIDTVVIQVNNPYGERTVSLPYSKIYRLTGLNAWMEDEKGNLLQTVSKKAWIDRSRGEESAMFVDERERCLRPSYVRYPYRFCYTFVYHISQFCQLIDWMPADTAQMAVREALLYVYTPKGVPIRTHVTMIGSACTDTIGNIVKTRYVVRKLPASDLSKENSLFREESPRVLVVPETFRFGIKGSLTGWRTFGNWYDKLNSGITILPPEEVDRIKHMVAGITDTATVVRTLYQDLQDHTRYVNVMLGIGGMKSWPASFVSVNKYGDCKALSNYMKAMLQYAGIRSYFLLISSGLHPEPFLTDFPSNQFNHIMLLVPMAKDSIWLECTSSVSPIGLISSFTQNRPALLVDGERSHLVYTPALTDKSVACKRNMDVRLLDNGTAEFCMFCQNRGLVFEYMTEIRKNVSSKWIPEYMSEFLPLQNAEDVSWNFRPSDRNKSFVELDMHFIKPKYLQYADGYCSFLQIPVDKGPMCLPKPDHRRLVLDFPVNETDSVCYHLPEGFNIESIPQSEKLSCTFGSYAVDWVKGGSRLFCIKSFCLKEGVYTPEEYATIHDFFASVEKSERQLVILKKLNNHKLCLP